MFVISKGSHVTIIRLVLHVHDCVLVILLFLRGRFSVVRSCRRRNVASQRHDNATTSSGDSGINATSSATSRDDNDGDEQQLAVKFVHKTLTDEQRALYEVNVMKTLEHMALLPLVATFSTPRSWIIVMPRYVVAMYVCCCLVVDDEVLMQNREFWN